MSPSWRMTLAFQSDCVEMYPVKSVNLCWNFDLIVVFAFASKRVICPLGSILALLTSNWFVSFSHPIFHNCVLNLCTLKLCLKLIVRILKRYNMIVILNVFLTVGMQLCLIHLRTPSNPFNYSSQMTSSLLHFLSQGKVHSSFKRSLEIDVVLLFRFGDFNASKYLVWSIIVSTSLPF